MNTKKVVKNGTRLVVGLSTSYCVNKAISALVQPDNVVGQVAKYVGTAAISSLVTKKIVEYTDQVVDEVLYL